MRVGDIDVVAVSDGMAKMPPQYFVNSDWSGHQDLLGPDGMLEIPLGCFVVRTGGKTVLVDSGIGPMENPLFQGGKLPNHLAEEGVSPDDVDLVLLTHLHADHTGWLVQDDKAFFANATVRFGAADWEQFVETDSPPVQITADAFRVLDAAGRLDPIDGDGEVAPGITSLHAPGHTLGHTCLVLSSGNARAFLLGDAVTCPVQLEEPEWQAISDIDPALAQRTREALWRELEGTDAVAVAAHFPGLQFGRILPGDGKRYFS